MFSIFANKIYFIIVVYSYMEALREDPSGSTAGFPSRGAGVVSKIKHCKV